MLHLFSQLLAPQSGAHRLGDHRRGAFRYFPSNPIHSVPLIDFEHLSLYIQKHLNAFFGDKTDKTDKTDKNRLKQIKPIEPDKNRLTFNTDRNRLVENL